MVPITKVRLTRERGALVVQTMGQTATGQKFVVAVTRMSAPEPVGKAFKTELGEAVDRLMNGL